MNKQEIIKTLQSGICEITYTDNHSVEDSIIGTLSQTHLPEEEEQYSHHKAWQDNIHVFNVNTEDWQILSVPSVIDIEQLTGEGALNNEKKLQASDEYLIGLFDNNEEISDEDFYESEGLTQ